MLRSRDFRARTVYGFSDERKQGCTGRKKAGEASSLKNWPGRSLGGWKKRGPIRGKKERIVAGSEKRGGILPLTHRESSHNNN